MGEKEDIEKVIAALLKVPTKSLMIIELANSIPIKDGLFVREELAAKQKEINLATQEAQMYGGKTSSCVQALSALRKRDQSEPNPEDD